MHSIIMRLIIADIGNKVYRARIFDAVRNSNSRPPGAISVETAKEGGKH